MTTLLIMRSLLFPVRGLPHSEISGSMLAEQLAGAYRSFATSFIASCCQDIRHIPLVAFN